MADINVLISNGTCYMSANKESYEDYIPCGNAATGNHYQCCSKGDSCYSSNACFNGDSRNTYIAGCTDENYNASACPFKGDYDNQEWVGVMHCAGKRGKRGQDTEWYGCEEDIDIPSVNKGNQSCHCTDLAELKPLFTDGQILTKFADLPRTSGGSINFQPGYTPTAVAATTPTLQEPTKAGDGGATSTAAVSSPAAAAASSGKSGLSTPALAGIGTGAAVGFFVLVVFVGFLCHRLTAKKNPDYHGLRPSATNASTPGHTDGSSNNNYGDKTSPNTINGANIPAQQQHHGGVSDGCSGHTHGFFKAELPADNPNVPIPSIETSPSPPHTHQEQQRPQPLQYQAYDPDRDRWVPPLSAISERSNETMMMHSPVSCVSPQSTGGEPISAHGTQHGQRSVGMEPIYEMQG
ncbi:hypothetical protein PG996_008575 [Apiospora saccharicola]|uniref:Uncharacterized protein n=1 Tax=Apiospora saccharicola TaxID=335842 RepID=A0ABR1UYB9_9PEZI